MNHLHKNVLLPATLALCFLPVLAEAETAAVDTATNLRAKPNLESTVVGVLQPGSTVKIITREGDFVLVKRLADNRRGFIKRELLIQGIPEQSSPNTSNLPTAAKPTLAANGNVRLRSKADVDSDIVAYLNPAVPLALISSEGEFAQVRRLDDNRTGWVRFKYLNQSSTNKEQAGVTPAPRGLLIGTTSVTLRKEANLESDIAGWINAETVVKPLSAKGEFMQVERLKDGRTGWVKRKYLEAAAAE